YAEATPDQTVRHWTMAHRRALEYFGGTPRRWIIDNLKSGVDDSDRDDIRLNPSYREFAQHYEIAVLPARKARATDKGLVEGCVKTVQTRILLALRHHTFFSLDTMNAAIRRELDRLNDAPMAKCGESRRALFEANERAALAALPARAWEWGEWIDRKVGQNCHVRFDKNHYSAPERYIGRQVDVRISERMVEVFLERGGERIAVHRRKAGRNQYGTNPDHMPEHHRAVCDIRRPDYGDILLGRARRIGANALAWAERCFASRDFPEQAFATVQGMIRLADDHGDERLDALCAEALDLNRLASGFLRERIKNGGEPDPPRTEPDETIPSHGNIRGGEYYGNDDGETP
ncbi:MAG: Mu transposase C-terminal domain-containing protein, partial [Gemmatimonadota bacterium]|nr:Mu transposase C-terminal domain-containing protein [Gemmatimonadota bacterium]